MTFDELKEKIQSKFGFGIKITEPHKLCDYKPAYGYIFEDYLKEADYWGHCDIDTILGNLDKFLGDLLNQNYAKLFALVIWNYIKIHMIIIGYLCCPLRENIYIRNHFLRAEQRFLMKWEVGQKM